MSEIIVKNIDELKEVILDKLKEGTVISIRFEEEVAYGEE